MAVVAGRTVAKFRYNAAIPIAGVIVVFGAMPLATSRWYLAPLELVPLAVIGWGWLAGVDVRAGELVVRYPVGRRHVPLSSIQGFTVTRRRVAAVRADDTTVWLPGVGLADLPKLADACGLRLPGDTPPPEGADPEETDPEETDPEGSDSGESGEPVTPTGSQGTRDSAG
jgi:hypothetical protein